MKFIPTSHFLGQHDLNLYPFSAQEGSKTTKKNASVIGKGLPRRLCRVSGLWIIKGGGAFREGIRIIDTKFKA